MKFLSYEGLELLVAEIKKAFVQKETGKSLSSNDFTNELLAKLEAVETGAEKNKVESVNGKVGVVALTSDDIRHLSKIAGESEETITVVLDRLIKTAENQAAELKKKAEKDSVYTKVDIDKKAEDWINTVTSVNTKTGAVVLTGMDLPLKADKPTTIAEEFKKMQEAIDEGTGLGGEVGEKLTEIETDLKEVKENYLPKTEANTLLDKKVDKVEGKTLTDENFTKEMKEKLTGVETKAQVNKIEGIKRNGVNLEITEKTVDIKVPTTISQLTNDSDFQSKSEVLTLINEQGRLKKKIVESLPLVTEAEDYTLYLIKNKTGNGYEEWMVVEDGWEILGDTAAIDFTGYLKEEDLSSITTEEIQKLFK